MTLMATMMLGDRYRLTERIATGGQGEVWRAEDTALDRLVAIKVLKSEYAGNAEFRDRFRREAQHAAGLSHPGLAQVYDYGDGQEEEPPYLVMEFVDGEPLSATIAREAPFAVDRTLDIVAKAAAGLAAAHAAGLVHRDVKPGNLLIGRDGTVKITDFGIARVIDAIPLTRTGIVMGTPLYLAPEQAAGETTTPASDLYGLGVIVYEMLTGRPPYEGHPAAVALAHRDMPLPPLPPSVPAGVRDLVTALTAKDPARRPRSAALVAERANGLILDPATTPVPQPRANGIPRGGARGDQTVRMGLPPGGMSYGGPRGDQTVRMGLPPGGMSYGGARGDQTVRMGLPPGGMSYGGPRREAMTRVGPPPDVPPAGPRHHRVLPLAMAGLVIVLAAGGGGWLLLASTRPDPAPQPTTRHPPATARPAHSGAPDVVHEATHRPRSVKHPDIHRGPGGHGKGKHGPGQD